MNEHYIVLSAKAPISRGMCVTVLPEYTFTTVWEAVSAATLEDQVWLVDAGNNTLKQIF